MSCRLSRALRLTFLLALLVYLGASFDACGPVFLGVGSTPNVPDQITFRVLGQIATPFSAVVSDARASWRINGVVPFSMVIVNQQPPSRMIVTKLANNSALLGGQIIKGFRVEQNASTSAPFGTLSIQTGGALAAIAPPAYPDVRFFVNGPTIETFTGLVEDKLKSFAFQQNAPTVFLFDSPSGRVDGSFNQVNHLGPFTVDLYYHQPPTKPQVCVITDRTVVVVKFPGCIATTLPGDVSLADFGAASDSESD